MIKQTIVLARKFSSDKLARTSGWLFIGFLTTGLFNYAFQIAMGRILPPAEFGSLNVFLGVFVVLSIPVGTLLMVLSKRTAEYRANNNHSGVKALLQRANRLVLKFGLAGLGLYFLASGIIADYLRAPSVVPVFLIGLCLFSALATPVNAAVLQGLQDYTWLGIYQGSAGPLKFFFCVLMVLMGFGVNGALIGLLITNAVLWMLAYYPLRQRLCAVSPTPITGSIVFRQAIPVLFANLAFAIITQLDLILVNRYFESHDAAMYASAAVLGRTVMYIPGTLVLAMFPMVSEQEALKKDTKALLMKSLLMTLALSGAGAAFFFLAPQWTIVTFLGSRYEEAAGLLKYFGLAMLPMALLLVLYHYLIARGRAAFSYVMMGGAGFELAFLHYSHASLLSVIVTVAVTGGLLLLTGIVQAWLYREKAAHRVNSSQGVIAVIPVTVPQSGGQQ